MDKYDDAANRHDMLTDELRRRLEVVMMNLGIAIEFIDEGKPLSAKNAIQVSLNVLNGDVDE